jgi:hypothetical protein
MPAIGIGVAWFGYSLTLWGFCLIKGYNVRFTELINPVKPYSGPWPPPTNIPATSTFPAGGVAAGQESPPEKLPKAV